MTGKDTAAGFSRLERTYHRCARELCATGKIQKEANSAKPAENKLDKLFKRMLDAPNPGRLLEQMAEARRAYAAQQNANKAANAGS